MNIRLFICRLFATAMAAIGTCGCVMEKQALAELQAKANIGKEQAQAAALPKVSGGTIKELEFEKEKGRLIWSFGIDVADSKGITEIAVEAFPARSSPSKTTHRSNRRRKTLNQVFQKVPLEIFGFQPFTNLAILDSCACS